MKLFVILYDPGYGESKYIKGVFASRHMAQKAMKTNRLYKYSQEGVDFDIEEYYLNKFE